MYKCLNVLDLCRNGEWVFDSIYIYILSMHLKNIICFKISPYHKLAFYVIWCLQHMNSFNFENNPLLCMHFYYNYMHRTTFQHVNTYLSPPLYTYIFVSTRYQIQNKSSPSLPYHWSFYIKLNIYAALQCCNCFIF